MEYEVIDTWGDTVAIFEDFQDAAKFALESGYAVKMKKIVGEETEEQLSIPKLLKE